MIIVIIALATILTFVTWMLLDKPALRYPLGIFSLAFLAFSVYLLTDHFVNHTGMRVQTTQTHKPIYSAADPKANFGVVIQEPIGTKSKHHVMVYRDQPTDKAPRAHFIPNKKKINQAAKQEATYRYGDTKDAMLTTRTKRYRFDSDWAKWLYGFGGEDGQLVSTKYVVTLPKKTWLVLSKDQAKQLQAALPQLKANLAKQAKLDPRFAMKLQELAAKEPDKLAELQVQKIRDVLGIHTD
ncbi:DUF4811 domain-containing protein [Streptococcus halichoeri]|uniref:DUF4811 domain-containing protein n=1 Tax=Streptococcus halichoeri TaxID=254785 RepID=UPI001357510A|nr:DUF4811 domain-containing protein [Streptococcus halichoeri]